jgi:hypothetical protein
LGCYFHRGIIVKGHIKGCGHGYLPAFSGSFSQQPMAYVAAGDSSSGTAKVTSGSKDGKASKTFEAVDSLAQLTMHIPTRSEQMGG